jgi:hypothetical protein
MAVAEALVAAEAGVGVHLPLALVAQVVGAVMAQYLFGLGKLQTTIGKPSCLNIRV